MNLFQRNDKFIRLLRLFGPACAGLILVFAVLLVLPPAASHADGPDKGYVVVVFPGEDATVREVAFTSSISRVGALQAAGYTVIANGSTVCSIDNVGCPATNCFCSSNWWSSAGWDSTTNAWDTMAWPPPDLTAGDVAGFRWSNTSWGPPLFPAPIYTAAQKAETWLLNQQQADGGYGSAGASVEVLLAAGANGIDGSAWIKDGITTSLGSYMLQTGAAFSKDGVTPVAGSGKLAVAYAATNGYWPVGGVKPMAYYSSTLKAYSVNPGENAWGILGTLALSQTVEADALQTLKADMQPNGGWEWFSGWGTDTNTTALALQALIAAGEPVTATTIVSGVAYLKATQNITDAGFPYNPAGGWPGAEASDVNSTAYVVQALYAAGEDPTAAAWTVNGTNPINYLLNLQLSDGSFPYGGIASDAATRQVIPALLGQPFPFEVNTVPAGASIPSSGGSANPVSGVTISTGSDTFTGTVEVYFVQLPAGEQSATPGNIGVMYDLAALYTANGLPATVQGIYTVTVTYDETLLPTGYPEEKLALFTWAGSTWVKEPTSVVDVVANTITATPNHFSLWAGLALYDIYLPVVLK